MHLAHSSLTLRAGKSIVEKRLRLLASKVARNFQVRESDEGKLSSPVFRGLGRSNPARLPHQTQSRLVDSSEDFEVPAPRAGSK